MKVQDILQKKSSEIFTVRPHQTLFEASQILATHNIGSLVVVNEQQHLIGILSERDIVHQFAEHGETTGSMTIREVMTTEVLIAVPDDDVAYLTSTMTNNRIRHLPVLQDGNLVGIVSIGDVVKAQLDFYEGESHYLQNYITGGYA